MRKNKIPSFRGRKEWKDCSLKSWDCKSLPSCGFFKYKKKERKKEESLEKEKEEEEKEEAKEEKEGEEAQEEPKFGC